MLLPQSKPQKCKCELLLLSLTPADEVNALVLDVGSLYVKGGYAGDDIPKAIFPSVSLTCDPKCGKPETPVVLKFLEFKPLSQELTTWTSLSAGAAWQRFKFYQRCCWADRGWRRSWGSGAQTPQLRPARMAPRRWTLTARTVGLRHSRASFSVAKSYWSGNCRCAVWCRETDLLPGDPSGSAATAATLWRSSR